MPSSSRAPASRPRVVVRQSGNWPSEKPHEIANRRSRETPYRHTERGASAGRGGHDSREASRHLCLTRFAFFAAFAAGQPVTAIFVVWLSTAPSWAVIVVGISNGAATAFLALTVTCLECPLTRRVTRLVTVTVLVVAHRLRTPGLSVVSTPCGPSGSVRSKLDTGASGTVSKWE